MHDFFLYILFCFCNPLRSGKCLSVRVFCCRYDKIARLRKHSTRTTKKVFFFGKLFILRRQRAHSQMVYHGMFYITIITEFTIQFYVNNIYTMFILTFCLAFLRSEKEKALRFVVGVLICWRIAKLRFIPQSKKCIGI